MANPVKWTIDKVRRLNELIWHSPRKEISRWESFIFKQLRIIILAARGFSNDKVQLRASALTFYTLLSIVPVVAIIFAMAKGFNLDKNLEQFIIEKFSTQQEILEWLLTNARNALEETSGGYIAGVGFIILFWSVISLLQNIESSFNHIWQVRHSRPWYRQVTDYLTFLLIAPIFLVLSSSTTLYVSRFLSQAAILSMFKPVLALAPYLLWCITMTILFIIMPNTKVRFRPALISGFIAGIIQNILFYFYIDLQAGIGKLSLIYGTFASIPLFIVWIQAAWIVVLIGAELSYANQNIKRFEMEFESLNISYYQKRALVLIIMNRIIRNFSNGDKPMTAEDIALALKIPVRLAKEILQELSNIHLISVISDNNSEHAYQPALDINRLTISYVFSRLDRKGSSLISISDNDEYEKVTGILDKFDRVIAKSGSNVLIKDL